MERFATIFIFRLEHELVSPSTSGGNVRGPARAQTAVYNGFVEVTLRTTANASEEICSVFFTFDAFFLPVVNQHNQCPCRFFNPRRDKFGGYKASTRMPPTRYHGMQ